jgi:hypothetical protein
MIFKEKHPLKTKYVNKKDTPKISTEIVIKEDFAPVDLNKQYQIDLVDKKPSWRNRFRNKLQISNNNITALSYWNNFLSSITIVSSIFVVAILSTIIINQYNQLPEQFPLFFSQYSKTWQLVEKEILIFAPIVLGLLLTLIIQFNRFVYLFDKRLSQMVNNIVIIFNILIMIATLQLYSLVMIY